MRKQTQKLVEVMLRGAEFGSDEERHLHLLLTAALAYSVLAHVFLLAFYCAAGHGLFSLVNTASLCLYGVMYAALLRKKRHLAVGLFFSLEVTLYTLFSVTLSGAGNYTILYYFLVLVVQVVAPYAKPAVRAGVSAFLWGCILYSLLIGRWAAPAVVLSGGMNRLLVMFNVQLAFVGFVVELLIGDFLQKIVYDYGRSQLEKYKRQARTDELTGQFNRRYAKALFHTLPGRCAWVAAMLDIDDFKQVNDGYGHAAGDAVLVALSNRMRESLRKTDVIIRWGGEEFLLLLRDVNMATAYMILEKLRQDIEGMEIRAGNAALRITVSIGAAPFDMANPDASIARCDEKMYEGKSLGKNQVHG